MSESDPNSAAGEFERVRDRLREEIVQLHYCWHEYRLLFADSSERLRLLHVCARRFFGTVRLLLLREIILGISRLSDPPETLGKSNLTIGFLLTDPSLDDCAPEVREQLQSLVLGVIDRAATIRPHRNKYIAHLDHDIAIGPMTDLLPGLPRSTISGAIDQIESVYNTHARLVRDIVSYNSFELHSTGSARALIEILEHSERWKLVADLPEESPGE